MKDKIETIEIDDNVIEGVTSEEIAEAIEDMKTKKEKLIKIAKIGGGILGAAALGTMLVAAIGFLAGDSSKNENADSSTIVDDESESEDEDDETSSVDADESPFEN